MRLQEIAACCRRHPDATLTFVGPDGSSQTQTFEELGERVGRLAEQLQAGGLQPGHTVGVQAENAIDWVVWDLAATGLGAVVRPYPTHHEFDASERIAEHGLALLVSDREGHAGADHFAPLSPEAFAPAMVDATAPRQEHPDLLSIVCSSGTTGREKMLMISRSGAAATRAWMSAEFDLTPADRHVVFLPLPNFQQRQQVFVCIENGVSLTLCGYQRAMQAIRSGRPTFLLAPPALYETMLSVAQGAAGAVTLPTLFGGAVRFLITGMAPIRPKVMAAYWEAGLELLEGYGLTECGIIACNTPRHNRVGTVGPLVDPQAVSFSEEGEVLVRQRFPLSLGYLGDEALNKATWQPDGTVLTGDVGHLDDDGFLVLDGRLKDMIPLPSGKKLHPADLEQLLLQLPGVEDAIAVDNGAGVTAVLNLSAGTSDASIRMALRSLPGHLDVAGAVNQIIVTDIPLTANPIFSTANMKLNRRLVGRHFLGAAA